MKTVREVLVEAAGYVEQGWAQGGRAPGCVCAVEAIAASMYTGSGAVDMKLFNQALDALRHQIGGPSAAGTIVKWNDAPGRIKEQVVTALLGAAIGSDAQ